jgi:mannitol/fructose-specific phosphotransferase system IIA component (Ntr-type)
VATTIIMIFLLVAFNVESVAKLASAFQLLLFGILNISVIVMRESKIEGYDPGFRSPWYPWMQIAGFFISLFLIAEMGLLSIIFTIAIAAVSVVWYFSYSKDKVEREGAIYHVHARLGKYQHEGLEREMRGIMREKGLRKEDPYEKAIGRALVLDLSNDLHVDEITKTVSNAFAERVDISAEKIYSLFLEDYREGIIPVGNACAIKHVRVEEDVDTEVALIRIKDGLPFDSVNLESNQKDLDEELNSLIYLMSSSEQSGQHLRILAHLAEMIDVIDFKERWLNAKDEAELREILLRDERFINMTISDDDPTKEMIDKRVKDISLPGSTLITVVKRGEKIIYAHGKTEIKEGDRLSLIGEKSDINEVREKYLLD